MNDRIVAALEAATTIPWWDLTPLLTGVALIALLLIRFIASAVRAIRDLSEEKRDTTIQLLLTIGFLVVVGALVAEGIIGFARDEMGLGPVLSVAVFIGIDGVAGFFAHTAYRWAKVGGRALFPRAMVILIITGSAWFQWIHAADLALAAQVARAGMPLIAALLLETLLVSRRKSWKQAQTTTGTSVPRARWLWDPIGSAGITRRQQLWAVPDWEDALELHMIRLEAIQRLRREFGPFWAWKVPATVAVRLRKGFRVPDAAAMVDDIITEHQSQERSQQANDLTDLLEIPPARDPRVFEKAVKAETEAILAYRQRLSERDLCTAYGVPTTNRRWAKQVKKEAASRAEEKRSSAPTDPVPA
ncbi:DUF2637 domain-containing protein [Nocardiopsis exhalans]|uniref:DUF2637 domain-containing protein n=1 Tax=Nocardiopsis exhalans TaxID=163604 RepID=A0ABY5DFB0_9ACTN|nr:DUF2637 domain-containing protein [Nocardiopsis exhalans]USY21710.1 DUF2637 domain-containing protein [Nocardiopsis exhalans]